MRLLRGGHARCDWLSKDDTMTDVTMLNDAMTRNGCELYGSATQSRTQGH